ncbi:MAG TPA: DUF5667 domain-containing protein [Mycobacteriales bacterium]|nr:DUF5667 domain-containing protein [Mycobacteriales bacterium]
MSRREDFARLADGDVAVEDVAVSGLGEIATALRTMSRQITLPAPDPEFRGDLRQRLVAIATVQAAEPAIAGVTTDGASRVAGRRTSRTDTRRMPRGRRTIVAVAGSAVFFGSVAGVAVAASRSLPGSPFYDLKLATESAQLWTAQGSLAKGHRHLEFAATRLTEAQRLSPSSSHLAATLNAMDSQTRDGANDLVAAAHSSSSTAPLVQLQQFAHRQYAGLQQLLKTAPPALRQREIRSATLVEIINDQAATLSAACTTCTGATSGGGLGNIGGLLKQALPTPGGGNGSGQAQPGPGSITSHRRHGHGTQPVPVPSSKVVPTPKSGLPLPGPSSLPSTLKSLLPTALPTALPTKLPSLLPSLPPLLPSSLPSVLPTIKL